MTVELWVTATDGRSGLHEYVKKLLDKKIISDAKMLVDVYKRDEVDVEKFYRDPQLVSLDFEKGGHDFFQNRALITVSTLQDVFAISDCLDYEIIICSNAYVESSIPEKAACRFIEIYDGYRE